MIKNIQKAEKWFKSFFLLITFIYIYLKHIILYVLNKRVNSWKRLECMECTLFFYKGLHKLACIATHARKITNFYSYYYIRIGWLSKANILWIISIKKWHQQLFF